MAAQNVSRTQWYIQNRQNSTYEVWHRRWEDDPAWKSADNIEMLQDSRGEQAEVSDEEFTAAQLLVSYYRQYVATAKFIFNAPQRAPDKDGQAVYVPPTIDGTLVYTTYDGSEERKAVEIKTSHSADENNVYFYTSEYQHNAVEQTDGIYWIVTSTTHLGLHADARRSRYRSTLYTCYWTPPHRPISIDQEIDRERRQERERKRLREERRRQQQLSHRR